MTKLVTGVVKELAVLATGRDICFHGNVPIINPTPLINPNTHALPSRGSGEYKNKAAQANIVIHPRMRRASGILGGGVVWVIV